MIVNKNKLRSSFYIAFCCLLIGSLIVIGMQKGIISEFSVERIQTLKSGQSMRGRAGIWKVGIKMANDHLIIGVGLKKFSSNFNKYAGILSLQSGGRGPHNTYISILAETGIVGFILAFWIIGAFAYILRKSKRKVDSILSRIPELN